MIGQSAALLPNLVMIENGRRSETERGLVFEEGLIIQRKLKIQSKPLGKLSGAIWLRIMSGMGGLNRLRKQISRAKKQRAILKSKIENHLAASDFMKMKSRDFLLFGKTLRAFSTKSMMETH